MIEQEKYQATQCLDYEEYFSAFVKRHIPGGFNGFRIFHIQKESNPWKSV